jgi:hypothetical protein
MNTVASTEKYPNTASAVTPSMVPVFWKAHGNVKNPEPTTQFRVKHTPTQKENFGAMLSASMIET